MSMFDKYKHINVIYLANVQNEYDTMLIGGKYAICVEEARWLYITNSYFHATAVMMVFT